MMKINTFSVSGQKREQGFTLIEVMVAMAIGMVVSAGIFEIFLTSKESQDVVYDQIELMDESRVAMEILSYDLKKAGLWGKTSDAKQLLQNETARTFVAAKLAAANDCVSTKCNWTADQGVNLGWALDALKGVFGISEMDITTNGFPYTGCISGAYLTGDVLEIRYAGEKIAKDRLDKSTVYIVSQGQFSDVFYGTAPDPHQPEAAEVKYGDDYATDPTDPPVTYHKYEAILYYVSKWTDGNSISNDGVPSLRRVSLQSGPELVDDVVLSGVENLKVQFGLDMDKNEDTVSINQYRDADNIGKTAAITDWGKLRAVQVWALVRSKKTRDDNKLQTFDVPGDSFAGVTADGYRRIMVSNATKLRNIDYVD